MRESHTAVLERRVRIGAEHDCEPYEVAWASELIYFVYADTDVLLQPQISADGQRWVDDGPAEAAPVVRRTHFGGWSRLVLRTDDEAVVDVYLVLKE